MCALFNMEVMEFFGVQVSFMLPDRSREREYSVASEMLKDLT